MPSFSDLAQPGTHVETFPWAGRQRKFICVTPENLSSTQTVPLLFFLHGGGGRAAQAMQTYGWTEKARAEHFIVVFPEAVGAAPDLPGSFALNPNVWRDGRPGERSPEVDDVGFFKALLDRLEATLPVDRRRIFVSGFSMGGAMSFRLGSQFADRIAAIAPIASECYAQAEKLPRPLPVYYLVNMEDPLVPYGGGKTRRPWGKEVDAAPVQVSLDHWLALDGCPATPLSTVDHDGYHVSTYGADPQHPLIVFTKVDGNGHHYPGTVEPLPKWISGPTVDPFQATDAIWDFFKNHPLTP